MIVNMPLLNETWREESSTKTKLLKLPLPTPEAIQHSEKLLRHIIHEIRTQGGAIPFSDFMQHALYTPGLGYYSSGNQKFGPEGDFVTAPEISPLYSYCFARECQAVFNALSNTVSNPTPNPNGCPNGNILELGAGTGQMAADILNYLSRHPSSPNQTPSQTLHQASINKYFILEVSPELKERQYHTLAKQCPHMLNRVEWLNTLPRPGFKGVILANEVCDAMSVHRFCWNNSALQELCVAENNTQLQLISQPPTPFLQNTLQENYFSEMIQDIQQHPSYTSEVNLNMAPWINSLADALAEGVIFIIDYGFPKHEYYHPSRNSGTLMCHYRHYSHSDPFLWPGLQDITAHVDFTLIAEAASNAGLNVAGFTNQASFLLSVGLLDLVQTEAHAHTSPLVMNQAIQTLTSPAEMGELFKVMALSKNYSHPIAGFLLNDLRYRL